MSAWRAVLTALLLWPGLPSANPDAGSIDAGRPVGAIFDEAARAAARDRNRRGLRLAARGDQPGALSAFREAHALNPSDPEIANNLGYLHLLLGDRAEAERFLRESIRLAHRRASAIDNLAELLADDPAPLRQAEAAALLARLRTLRGNDPRIVRRQARLAAKRGRFDEARRFYDAVLAVSPPDGALAMELGDFHRALGDLDRAMSWYRRAESADDATASERIRALKIEQETRRFGWVSPGDGPSTAARDRRSRGRAALGAGQSEEAIRLLEEAIKLAPSYAAAYADLGDAHRAAGRNTDAELAYLRALVLDGGHAEAARRLGDLFRDTERWPDAATLWTRALAIRPEWTDLNLPIARAWQSAGDIQRALSQVRLALADLPEDAPDDQLRELETTLSRQLPAEPREETPSVASPVAQAIVLAQVHFTRGEIDEAMAVLGGLEPDLKGPRVHALEGRIFLASRRPADAVDAIAASLRLDPDQPELRWLRARTLLDLGRVREGSGELDRAAADGWHEAQLHRLKRQVDGEGNWWTDIAAYPELHATRADAEILARAAKGGVAEGASALASELTERMQRVTLAAVGLAGLVLVILLSLARRRWGGDTIAHLVEAHPEAGTDIQRVLSAIRHEVLKHNTMALSGLSDALHSKTDVVARAAWVRQSLLGAPDDPCPEAAIHRLRGYAEQLRQIGRSHGTRLNLERRDPAMSALLGGFRTLESIAGDLDRIVTRGKASRRTRRAIARAANALNVRGLGALRRLLDQLKIFEIAVPDLRATFDRTRREPSFADVSIAPLVIDGGESLPARIEMPRAAFDDILANLMRNAIQSSARSMASRSEVVIGLTIEDDEDLITGLCNVRFRVRDRSPEALTEDMLQGRFIEDGLGLTGDLVTRYDGSLTVEPDSSPWTKAVVLTLPRSEAADTAQRMAVTGLPPEEDIWTR